MFATVLSPVLAPVSLSNKVGREGPGTIVCACPNKPITGDHDRREILEAVKQTVIIVMRWQNQPQRKLATQTKTGVK